MRQKEVLKNTHQLNNTSSDIVLYSSLTKPFVSVVGTLKNC